MEAAADGPQMGARKVLIIGGSSGIGKATARLAASAGAEVVIASRHEESLREARTEIGGNVSSCTVDVRDPRSLDACFEANAPFDHLVVTATDVRPATFLEVDVDDARQIFEVKFWGQFTAAQLAAPCIRSGGSITLFSGVAASRPVVGMSVIAAADGAIEALVRSLAVELSPIRVNGIAPGFVDTHDMDASRKSELSNRLPARRMGEAADVARAVVSLMENTFVTGIVLTIDGGHHLV